MAQEKSCKRFRAPGTSITNALAFLFIVCLVECATGSCLSFGHSCWGGHGKRSPKPPADAPRADWFIAKLLRNQDTNSDLNHARPGLKTDDVNAILPIDAPDYSPIADRLGSASEEIPAPMVFFRSSKAKPMLDDDFLSKLKLWQIRQIMRAAASSEE